MVVLFKKWVSILFNVYGKCESVTILLARHYKIMRHTHIPRKNEGPGAGAVADQSLKTPNTGRMGHEIISNLDSCTPSLAEMAQKE